MHIVLAVFIVVGCWYHVTIWYGAMGIAWPDTSWGYEVWIYLAIGVWFSDRLARVVRVMKNGVLRSTVTELEGGEYVRVDVPRGHWGAEEPGRHVYVCFPTLDLRRPWENHPFSVVPTHMLRGSELGSGGTPGDLEAGERWTGDEEKQPKTTIAPHSSPGGANSATNDARITLVIKKGSGLTKYLKTHDSLLTLLDGPYANSQPKEILRCDRILLVAGGIGITGVLPWAYSHRNVKLAWGVSESARPLLEVFELGGIVDKEVRVGRRLDVVELIEVEAKAGWDRVGVVVSGPGGLCDDVRAAVVAAGRKGKTVFELEVDAYSW